MNNSPIRCINRALQVFCVVMAFFVCFAVLSSSHMEIRQISGHAAKFALDVDHESSVVPPRSSFFQSRVKWTPLLVPLVIFLSQLFINPRRKPLKHRRFAHISLLLKRLFLMPLKHTSTAI